MEQPTGVGVHTQVVNSSAQHRNNASADGVNSTSIVQNVEVQSVSDKFGFEVFTEELESFLDKRIEAVDSDWGVVTEEDLKALRLFFHTIIRAKWEEDVDGNVPVEFKIYVLQN